MKAQGDLTRKLLERAYEVDFFQMKSGEKCHISSKNFYRAWLREPHDLSALVKEYGNVLIIAKFVRVEFILYGKSIASIDNKS